MINPNWNRWIFASASNYFSNVLTTNTLGYTLYIQGSEGGNQTQGLEFRLSGPIWNQRTKNLYHGSVVINMLIRTLKDQSDFHKNYRIVGLVEAAFAETIAVKKYGNGLADDENATIGCLLLERKGEGDIKTTHFGQIVDEVPLIQSTVEGNYKIDLSTEE